MPRKAPVQLSMGDVWLEEDVEKWIAVARPWQIDDPQQGVGPAPRRRRRQPPS